MSSRSNEVNDQELAMGSWEAEAVHDFRLSEERPVPEEEEAVNTVWQSMYEKGLGRKVSQWNYPPKTPPVSPADSESLMSPGPEGEKKDLAAVHRERALNFGLMKKDDGREWRRRTYSSPPTIESLQKSHKHKDNHKATDDKSHK